MTSAPNAGSCAFPCTFNGTSHRQRKPLAGAGDPCLHPGRRNEELRLVSVEGTLDVRSTEWKRLDGLEGLGSVGGDTGIVSDPSLAKCDVEAFDERGDRIAWIVRATTKRQTVRAERRRRPRHAACHRAGPPDNARCDRDFLNDAHWINRLAEHRLL
jgi:hypothetical protein